MKSQSLSIDLIIADAGTQMRAGTRQEIVREYAELAKDSKEWPFETNIVVFKDGEKHYLGDGFHRYLGCRQAGRASVMCDVCEGGIRDAIKYALRANQSHGLRRSSEDKRTAVSFILNDAEWNQLSSRVIADMAGVSPSLVDAVRKEVEVEVPFKGTSEKPDAEGAEVLQTRIGADGKRYSVSATKPSPPQDESPKPEIAAQEEYEDLVDDEPVAKPKPGSEVISAAKIIDELIRSCYSPLVKGIDKAAKAIGEKGPNYNACYDALNVIGDSLDLMRANKP